MKDLAICSNGMTFKNINKTKEVKSLKKVLKRKQRQCSRKYEQNKKGKEYVKTKNIIKFEDKDFINTLNDFERKTFGKFSVLENKKVYKRYKNEILSGIKKCNKDFIESLWKNYSFSFNVDKKLKKIKFDKPVLFMAGRQDICVGYKDLYKLLEDYPRATFSVIDIAGHNLQIEQPELFNSLVENFLIRAKNNINKF